MSQPIDELIGVYDADSTLWGEVSYWIGARVGKSHCSLCDLTHGMFTKKSTWKQCEASLEVPFTTFHRNDAPSDVLATANGAFPIVLARSAGQLSIALTVQELNAMNGSIDAFQKWWERYVS